MVEVKLHGTKIAERTAPGIYVLTPTGRRALRADVMAWAHILQILLNDSNGQGLDVDGGKIKISPDLTP